MTQHLSQEEEGDHRQHVEQLHEKSLTGGGGRSDVTKSLHSNSTLFFRSSRTSPFPSPIWTAGSINYVGCDSVDGVDGGSVDVCCVTLSVGKIIQNSKISCPHS